MDCGGIRKSQVGLKSTVHTSNSNLKTVVLLTVIWRLEYDFLTNSDDLSALGL